MFSTGSGGFESNATVEEVTKKEKKEKDDVLCHSI